MLVQNKYHHRLDFTALIKEFKSVTVYNLTIDSFGSFIIYSEGRVPYHKKV